MKTRASPGLRLMPGCRTPKQRSKQPDPLSSILIQILEVAQQEQAADPQVRVLDLCRQIEHEHCGFGGASRRHITVLVRDASDGGERLLSMQVDLILPTRPI